MDGPLPGGRKTVIGPVGAWLLFVTAVLALGLAGVLGKVFEWVTKNGTLIIIVLILALSFAVALK